MKMKKTSLAGCTKFLVEDQRFLKPERFLELERCGAGLLLPLRCERARRSPV